VGPARNRIAGALVAIVIASILGVCLVSLGSNRGELRDRIAVGMGLCFAIATLLLLLLVALTTIQYRIHLRRLRKRPALSDDAFVALLPRAGSLDRKAAEGAVRIARALAAEHLKEFGGAWIRPTDRLEEDLHLYDMGPWIFEDFSYKLAESLDVDEDLVDRALNSRTITTFGDLIQAIAELSNRAGSEANRHDPLWDRDLDA
jgi:hypothetical protein